MQLFKTKAFARDAKKLGLTDTELFAAIAAADRGLLDADLGGGVIKQRIAREGGGKSGGYRAIVVLKSRERAFYVFVFAKNERQNIEKRELAAFKKFASTLLALDDDALAKAVASGALIEMNEEAEAIE